MKKVRAFLKEIDFGWRAARLRLIILGGLVQSLAVRSFLVPAQLVSGGVSGLAQSLLSMDWPTVWSPWWQISLSCWDGNTGRTAVRDTNDVIGVFLYNSDRSAAGATGSNPITDDLC